MCGVLGRNSRGEDGLVTVKVRLTLFNCSRIFAVLFWSSIVFSVCCCVGWYAVKGKAGYCKSGCKVVFWLF